MGFQLNQMDFYCQFYFYKMFNVELYIKIYLEKKYYLTAKLDIHDSVIEEQFFH